MEDKHIKDLMDIINKRKKSLIIIFMLVVSINIIFSFAGYGFGITAISYMVPLLFIVIDKSNIALKLEKILIRTHKEDFDKYRQNNTYVNMTINRAEIFIKSCFFEKLEKSQDICDLANSVKSYNESILVYFFSSFIVTIMFKLIQF